MNSFLSGSEVSSAQRGRRQDERRTSAAVHEQRALSEELCGHTTRPLVSQQSISERAAVRLLGELFYVVHSG